MLRIVRDLERLINNANERPFAVVKAKMSIKHVSDSFMNDYFIIKKKKNWKKDSDSEIMNMDQAAIRCFRKNREIFKIALQNEHGTIYELINNPFKSN